MKTLLERLEDPRPMIYDGGFGAELFARGVQLTNSTLANESHPDDVVGVHTAFIEAGAEAIGTNTFVASSLHMDMAGKNGDEAEAILRLAVEHARTAVDKSGREVYIAGSIGPSPGAIEADSGDTDFGIANHLVREAHRRMAQTLAEGGVDFFSIETMFSAKEAAIAVDEARKTGLPIAVNMTYKFTKDRRTGEVVYRTDWGHSAVDLLETLSSGSFSNGDDLLDHVHLLGLNCGAESQQVEHTGMPYAVNGTRQLKKAMEQKGIAKKMMAYPNAGMPRLDKNHLTYYSQTPEEMVTLLPDLLDEGAYFIGGCCGTTPVHIKAFRQTVDAHLGLKTD
jgi:5-methyltetrahydrofolate--homocysteine methyltransferase